MSDATRREQVRLDDLADVVEGLRVLAGVQDEQVLFLSDRLFEQYCSTVDVPESAAFRRWLAQRLLAQLAPEGA